MLDIERESSAAAAVGALPGDAGFVGVLPVDIERPHSKKLAQKGYDTEPRSERFEIPALRPV